MGAAAAFVPVEQGSSQTLRGFLVAMLATLRDAAGNTTIDGLDATGTWPALKGREALKVTWDESGAEKRGSRELFAEYRKLARTEGTVAGKSTGAVTLPPIITLRASV